MSIVLINDQAPTYKLDSTEKNTTNISITQRRDSSDRKTTITIIQNLIVTSLEIL